ncbi:translation initiation factor eIF-2B subunit gamma [Chelonus insularis]|uniref:translation initiation factor eIF-2B subunit gamma n=1 Tax=Chelonus insularis TaxID=460826 RepID=UPI00158BA026|nr:translation initiation factor eIF-2B subunit gamma [Chelonus insularis]
MVKYIEFQAVVLAGGKGSRMTELTAGKTKCLLPIRNMPMIYYPLQSLEKAGFTETIVVVTENIKKEVSTVLDKLNLNIRLEIVAIPDGEDLGTADAIRYIHDKIHTDFIVVSCDLIANIDINEILNTYRKHNASVVAAMFPSPKISSTFITPGSKSKQKPEVDLIGIDDTTNRLVFLASASDFEDSIDMTKLVKIKKHTTFTVYSKLLDAHFYVISKWILDFLVHNKSFGTLKGELLPYIVNKQLSRSPKLPADDKNASVVKVDTREDIFRFAVRNNLDELIRKMSAFNDHNWDLGDAYHGDIIRCYAHITDKIALRANTIQMYSFANSPAFDLPLHNIENNVISPMATVKTNQVTASNIDEGALIDEKTSIKQSFIGPATIVEPKTRISDSIVMGNVTVKQRCIIQNCILCNGCTIEEGTELKDCLVGAHHTVSKGSNHSREVLTEMDRLMEI